METTTLKECQAELDKLDTEISDVIRQAEESLAKVIRTEIVMRLKGDGGTFWLRRVGGRIRLGYSSMTTDKPAAEWQRPVRARIAQMLPLFVEQLQQSLVEQAANRRSAIERAREGLSAIQKMVEENR